VLSFYVSSRQEVVLGREGAGSEVALRHLFGAVRSASSTAVRETGSALRVQEAEQPGRVARSSLFSASVL
jgi:hypothetical protein